VTGRLSTLSVRLAQRSRAHISDPGKGSSEIGTFYFELFE